MENSIEVSRKTKELSYDTSIPLLGLNPDKAFLKKDTCTHMFIVSLFTIAKTWKQPKSPYGRDCIRKVWYRYNLYCAIHLCHLQQHGWN